MAKIAIWIVPFASFLAELALASRQNEAQTLESTEDNVAKTPLRIFIKTLTGRKTNFNFELDNTVRQVKEALQEKEGIQVEQIRLIYSGKQMSDECTLADYNVKPGSTVHMVLQLRG